MLSQELKAQIFKLPPRDHFALISAIVESLQNTTIAQSDRSGAIQRMKESLIAERPAPTGEEVAVVLKD